MKKRITLLSTVLLCAASAVSGVIAANAITEIKAQIRPDFVIEIDGVKTEFKTAQGEVVYPILYEGTTYLPLRTIGNIMGKTVYWHEAEKRIELKNTTVTDADVIINTAAPEVTPKPQEKAVAENKPTNAPSDFITKERAKELALKAVGISADGVIFERVELDKDNGIWQYEVDFKKGNKEYDVDIAATDGRVLSKETDIDDDRFDD